MIYLGFDTKRCATHSINIRTQRILLQGIFLLLFGVCCLCRTRVLTFVFNVFAGVCVCVGGAGYAYFCQHHVDNSILLLLARAAAK